MITRWHADGRVSRRRGGGLHLRTPSMPRLATVSPLLPPPTIVSEASLRVCRRRVRISNHEERPSAGSPCRVRAPQLLPAPPPPRLQAARAASEPSSTVASARKRPAASVHAPLGLRPSRWLVALASSLVRAPTPRVRRAPHALSPLSARLRSVAPSAPTASAAMRE